MSSVADGKAESPDRPEQNFHQNRRIEMAGSEKEISQTEAHPEPKKARVCWTLFCSMLYISAFTFGGGFVIVTFMKRKFVDKLHWLEEREMLDMTALAQSAPGPIAVNAAIQVGWKISGFAGMLCAVLGTILPPMIILSIISLFYQLFATNRYVALVLKGMQAGVAAVILDVSVGLGLKVCQSGDWIRILVMIIAFVLTFFLKVNVIWIISGAAAVGFLAVSFRGKGGTSAS